MYVLWLIYLYNNILTTAKPRFVHLTSERSDNPNSNQRYIARRRSTEIPTTVGNEYFSPIWNSTCGSYLIDREPTTVHSEPVAWRQSCAHQTVWYGKYGNKTPGWQLKCVNQNSKLCLDEQWNGHQGIF